MAELLRRTQTFLMLYVHSFLYQEHEWDGMLLEQRKLHLPTVVKLPRMSQQKYQLPQK